MFFFQLYKSKRRTHGSEVRDSKMSVAAGKGDQELAGKKGREVKVVCPPCDQAAYVRGFVLLSSCVIAAIYDCVFDGPASSTAEFLFRTLKGEEVRRLQPYILTHKASVMHARRILNAIGWRLNFGSHAFRINGDIVWIPDMKYLKQPARAMIQWSTLGKYASDRVGRLTMVGIFEKLYGAILRNSVLLYKTEDEKALSNFDIFTRRLSTLYAHYEPGQPFSLSDLNKYLEADRCCWFVGYNQTAAGSFIATTLYSEYDIIKLQAQMSYDVIAQNSNQGFEEVKKIIDTKCPKMLVCFQNQELAQSLNLHPEFTFCICHGTMQIIFQDPNTEEIQVKYEQIQEQIDIRKQHNDGCKLERLESLWKDELLDLKRNWFRLQNFRSYELACNLLQNNIY